MKYFLPLLLMLSLQAHAASLTMTAALQGTNAAGGGGGSDYTNSLTLWINADHLWLTNDAAIPSFNESSPSNRTFYSQNADGVYKTSAVNGHAAIEVDGNRNFTNGNVKAGFFADTGANAVSIFALIKPASAGATMVPLQVPDMDSGAQLFVIWTGGTIYWDAPQSSARISGSEPVGWVGWHVVQFMRNGGSSVIVVDGVTISSGTGLSGTFSTNAGTFLLFGVPGARFSGQLAELRIYNEAVSMSNSNLIYTTLKTKGGL